MRVLTSEGQWEDIRTASVTLEGWDWGQVRLTDGPGGEPRFASYQEIYESNPWLFGTVNAVARGMSRLMLRVVERRGPDDVAPVRPGNAGAKQQLARAVRYPSGKGQVRFPGIPRISRTTVMYSTVTDKLVQGNALWEKITDGYGQVQGFRPHPWVGVTIDGDNPMPYVVENGTRRLGLDDVCHFGMYQGGSLVNPSPIKSLRATIALFDAVQRHLSSYFRNGAQLSGVLKVDRARLTPTNRQAIREEIQMLHSGPDSSYGVMITTGDYTPIGQTPDASRVIELAKQSRDEIFAAYGVPPPIMGVLDKAIMSNVVEMRAQYYRDLVGAHAVFFEGDLEAQVVDPVPAYDGVEILFDMEAALREEPEKRATSFREMSIVWTIDELRVRNGLKPLNIKGVTDVPWRPLNEAPVPEEALESNPRQGFEDINDEEDSE